VSRKGPGSFGNRIGQNNLAYETFTEPFQLPPGSRCRGLRCAVCASMIGGRLTRILMITALTPAECGGNHLDTVSVLICGEHDPDPTGEMAKHVISGLAAERCA